MPNNGNYPNKETARVAVLMGGMSSERDISFKSGKAVATALRARDWMVFEIDVGPDLPTLLRHNKISHAWLALHGKFGEDGCVQGLLEILRIPYTGSGVRACALSMDKHHTKQLLRSTNVVLATDLMVNRVQEGIHFPLPCVVKDPTGGSSIGIWMCQTTKDLEQGLKECLQQNDSALIESWIVGDEITVAVLDGKALPVVMIRPLNKFFDLEAKYTEGKTDYLVPAPISDAITHHAQMQAELAYKEIGMRGIARADFLVPENQPPVFLEINAIPGMTKTSLSPMAAQAAGISLDRKSVV